MPKTMPEAELLDETGFTWTDPAGHTWKVCMWGADPWLFWQHPDGFFVSHRRLTQMAVWIYEQAAFPEKYAEQRRAFEEMLAMVAKQIGVPKDLLPE